MNSEDNKAAFPPFLSLRRLLHIVAGYRSMGITTPVYVTRTLSPVRSVVVADDQEIRPAVRFSVPLGWRVSQCFPKHSLLFSVTPRYLISSCISISSVHQHGRLWWPPLACGSEEPQRLGLPSGHFKSKWNLSVVAFILASLRPKVFSQLIPPATNNVSSVLQIRWTLLCRAISNIFL